VNAPPPAPGVPASPTPIGPGRYRCDVLIIGAGVAGLYAASMLHDDLHVIVLDKGTAGRSGSSPWAQGGMAAALGPADSPASHAHDTMVAGDGLCDPVAVDVLTREAPQRVAHLLQLGTRFDALPGADPTDAYSLHLAREGAQSHARSVHTADATGAEMVRALRVVVGPRVQRLAAGAVALALDDGRVTGVHVLTADGEQATVEARAVLLATGGCGGLYAATTNQDHATGDGVALALAAGAAVRDIEFVQFHPTGLAIEGSWRFLLTEALRGAGATLHDIDGLRFMLDVHPDAELAPRHIVAKAILAQAGGAFLDATHLSAHTFETEFPTVLAGARAYGWDLATQRVPVTPAAHYMVGGVRTDPDGQTSVRGLWAAGEVASTGVHGANRMAGNSLVEALVFGRRAALAISRSMPSTHRATDAPPALAAGSTCDDLPDLRDRLRQMMWRNAGPIRTETALLQALDELDALEDELGPPATDPTQLELLAAITVSRAIAAGALLRDETRGGHIRDDHPSSSTRWQGVHTERTAPVPRRR
jgi:L-aspartate oxidase